MNIATSRLAVREVSYDEFSVYYLGDTIIGTAQYAAGEDYWEVVVINERDEQEVHWLCTPNRPSTNDITVFHNTHFNPTREDKANGKDED